MTPHVIEVKLLGPPRVEQDGALVAFDTRKAVALLAHLALTDRARPREALADLLWADTDPERARGALRRTLTTLRTAIGTSHVEATRDHVRLVKGAGLTVDVDVFRRLRADGDLQRAVEQFGGDFLDGFAVRDAPEFEDWVRLEAEGLRRELAAALAALAEANEEAGETASAIRSVQRWLSLDPLHEPAHRALIRLYAASGDRAAALVQYRECVRVLSRELGVAPLTETTELYEAVNRGASTAPPNDSVPAAEPQPPAPPFVGRADEVRALRTAYEGIGTDGRVALVEGEAGIGKTRLVEELFSALRADGARVLVGRAYEDESGLAYAPVVEAIRDRFREGDGWLTGVGEQALAEAARLVPELAGGRTPAADTPLDEPGAQIRFLTGVWDVLAAAVGGEEGGDVDDRDDRAAPGALLVDDAQWADDATIGLLGYGLRRLAGRPMLVVLTWRTPQDHPFRRSVAAMARAGGGVVLQLDRLDAESVAAFVGAGSAARDPDFARRLWETTEGVPLLLVEYARTAGDEPEAALPALPSGARELLRTRLDPVSETGRQVLAAAAVLGRSFGVDDVRDVSGRSGEETVTALEELVRRGLVREGSLDYDFCHELVRTLVYDETSLARRRLLHGRAADALSAPSAVLARHLHLAGRDADAALAYQHAAEQARAVFANAEALGHLRAALALGHPDRTALYSSVADLQTVLGDYSGALLSLQTAAAGAADLPAAGARANLTAVEHRLGRLQYRRGEVELAAAHLRDALAGTPESELADRSRITADLALVLAARGEQVQARSLADDAKALAEEAGDPRAACQAYNLLGMLATSDGDIDDALVKIRRSRALAEDVGDVDLQIAATNNLALAHRARHELPAAIELTVQALELCTALADRHREAALHNNLADLLHASGRTDEAMVHLKDAATIFAEVGAQSEPQPEIWKLVRW